MKKLLRRFATEFSFAVLTVSFCVAAVSALKVLRVTPTYSVVPAAQAAIQQNRVKKVKDVSALRVNNADDRKLADFFDREGPSLLENQIIYIPTHESNPVPPSPNVVPGMDSREDSLRGVVCASDAVIVGPPVDSRTLLNRSETFLFTDFTIAVTDWVSPPGGPGTVHVAMLGGAVEVGNTLLRSTALPLLELQMPTLLFLQKIPGVTKAYGLASRPVRLAQGKVLTTDLPNTLDKDLMVDPAVNTVLPWIAHNRAICRDQK